MVEAIKLDFYFAISDFTSFLYLLDIKLFVNLVIISEHRFYTKSVRENISRSKSIRREREAAEKYNFRPMLSKKSLHLASQMKSPKERLFERVEHDLQKQQIFSNMDCKKSY